MIWYNTQSRDHSQKPKAVPVFESNWMSQKMHRINENYGVVPSEQNFKLTTNCLIISESLFIGKIFSLLPVIYSSKFIGDLSVEEDTTVTFIKWFTKDLINTYHIYNQNKLPLSLQRITNMNQFRSIKNASSKFRSSRHQLRIDSFRD